MPMAAVLGLLSLVAVLFMVLITNPIGRTAGPIWVVVGLTFYYFYRRRRGLPFRTSVKRDWPAEQIAAYEDSGEIELAEEYRENLRRRERLAAKEMNPPVR